MGQEVFAELSRLESTGLAGQQHASLPQQVKPSRVSGWGRPGSGDGGGGVRGGAGTGSRAGETPVLLAGVEEDEEEEEEEEEDDEDDEDDDLVGEDEVEEARVGGGSGGGGGRAGGVTMTEEVVETCVRVRDMLEACPQARHYVMSADR